MERLCEVDLTDLLPFLGKPQSRRRDENRQHNIDQGEELGPSVLAGDKRRAVQTNSSTIPKAENDRAG